MQGLAIDPKNLHWGCPRRPIKDQPAYWGELMTVYRMYKNGVMPDEGSLAQQSSKGIKMLTCLESAFDRFEYERMEDLRRKSGASSG